MGRKLFQHYFVRKHILSRISRVMENRWMFLGNVNLILSRLKQITVIRAEDFDNQIRDGV